MMDDRSLPCSGCQPLADVVGWGQGVSVVLPPTGQVRLLVPWLAECTHAPGVREGLGP